MLLSARGDPLSEPSHTIEYMFDLRRWLTKRWCRMRASGPSSYAGSMGRVSLEEHAALVALLRTRPGGMRWTDVVTDVLESGSALEVWHRMTPATLMEMPGETSVLTAAARDIETWVGQGSTVLTTPGSAYGRVAIARRELIQTDANKNWQCSRLVNSVVFCPARQVESPWWSIASSGRDHRHGPR